MKVSFLIAEEVRGELNSKLTILGLFPGDVIIMIKDTRQEFAIQNLPQGLERLAIVAIISDAPDGNHLLAGKVYDPDGELYQTEFSLGEAETKKRFSHTVIIELKPFLVSKFGIYKFEFSVDGELFPFPFEIREQE